AAPGAASTPARRRFLFGGLAMAGGVAGVGAGVLSRIAPWYTVTLSNIVNPKVETTNPSPRPEWAASRVRAYRRLGRTGFEVSDVSLGSGRIAGSTNGEAIARAAIERGVNYFDTSPDYSEAGSELVLGRAIQGRRDRMFLATKFCTPTGHLGAQASVGEYVRVVEDSLRRLQTDYVDLVHIHSCDSVERLMAENAHEAFDRLREQGKARFLGFSSHTPNLVDVADRAIESGRFDVMMLAYHHGAWPHLADVIARAARADVGVVAMKTLKGARHKGMEAFRGETDAYSQAAFKWVLSNPDVACLVVSFFELQHVDEYLYASGRALEEHDVALLERYDREIAGVHCYAHCGDCLDACPLDVPIADVLRHRMYFEDYGTQKLAMQEYARLERDASVCVGCAAPCAGACPHGLPLQERLVDAHRMLTLV
ncbi:MAG: aldo/keto reductase, partial [Myxococcales bacterium]|nr:aldo/keto reductase [Myxococcales bacterium]